MAHMIGNVLNIFLKMNIEMRAFRNYVQYEHAL